jgi:uncharacterized membrane protein YhaH (DUF805 family)
MNIITNCFIAAVKKYAVFKGRARRREYWMFILFYMIITTILGAVDAALIDTDNKEAVYNFPFLTFIAMFGLILPGISVFVRRLHDTGRSGWWWLIVFVPGIGGIVLLVFLVLDSEGENKYGPNPKAATA